MAVDEFLTIKEVAEMLGISRQAVYNRLDKDFKPYLTIKDGKKLLNKAVLREKDPDQVSIDLTSNLSTYLTDTLHILKAQNEILSQELEVKNKQIAELTETVKTQAQSINAERQTELADKLIEGNQQLSTVTEPVKQEDPLKGENFLKKLFRKKKN